MTEPVRGAATFQAAAADYDRLVGRYSAALAPELIAHVGITTGQRALDVGCGPGALTRELARRLGADQVTAIDPSAPFAAACRDRVPGVRVEVAPAEHLPFEDASFDVTWRMARLTPLGREALRIGLRERLGVADTPFTLSAGPGGLRTGAGPIVRPRLV